MEYLSGVEKRWVFGEGGWVKLALIGDKIPDFYFYVLKCPSARHSVFRSTPQNLSTLREYSQ